MLISRSSNLKSSIFEEIITLLGAFASGVDDGVGGVGVAGADVAVGTGLDVACSVVGTGSSVAVGSAVAAGCTVAVLVSAGGAMVGRGAEVGSDAVEGAALRGTGVTVADTVTGATAACCGGAEGAGAGAALVQATPNTASAATTPAKRPLCPDGIRLSVTGQALFGINKHCTVQLVEGKFPGPGITTSRKTVIRHDCNSKALIFIRSDTSFRFFQSDADAWKLKDSDGIYRRARRVIEPQWVY